MSILIFLLKFLYFTCISSFILYSLNTIFYIFTFIRHHKKQAHKDSEVITRFKEYYLGRAKSASGSSDIAEPDSYTGFQNSKWSLTLPHTLPTVLIQLPVFNEKFVIKRLIESTLQLDYPHDKLEIQILDDSTDETSDLISNIIRCHHPKFNIQHIRREGRQDYKAGALRHGMQFSKANYIAIFDADFIPSKDFLFRTLPFFFLDSKIGMVQTRWGHVNEHLNTFTQAQAIGIDGHFVIEQSAKHYQNFFFNFNGTAGIWKRPAIIEAGGWHGDTLTEDIDLSYRAQLAGWKHYYLCDTISPAELPDNLLDFKSQQRRWAKGSIQTAKKLLLEIVRSPYGIVIKLQSFLHLTHYSLQFFIFLLAILTLPLIYFDVIYRSALLSMTLTISLLVPSMGYAFSQLVQKKNIKPQLYPYLMAIGIGMSINNGIAVMSGIFNKETHFIRTPKKGKQSPSTSSRPNPKQKSQTKTFYTLCKTKHWLIAELMMTIYCFTAFYLSCSKVENNKMILFFSAFIFLMAISYLTISILSLKEMIFYKVHKLKGSSKSNLRDAYFRI